MELVGIEKSLKAAVSDAFPIQELPPIEHMINAAADSTGEK